MNMLINISYILQIQKMPLRFWKSGNLSHRATTPLRLLLQITQLLLQNTLPFEITRTTSTSLYIATNSFYIAIIFTSLLLQLTFLLLCFTLLLLHLTWLLLYFVVHEYCVRHFTSILLQCMPPPLNITPLLIRFTLSAFHSDVLSMASSNSG